MDTVGGWGSLDVSSPVCLVLRLPPGVRVRAESLHQDPVVTKEQRHQSSTPPPPPRLHGLYLISSVVAGVGGAGWNVPGAEPLPAVTHAVTVTRPRGRLFTD